MMNEHPQIVEYSDSEDEEKQLKFYDSSEAENDDKAVLHYEFSDSSEAEDEDDDRSSVKYFDLNFEDDQPVSKTSSIQFQDKVKFVETPSTWPYSEDLWIQFAKFLAQFYFEMYDSYRDSTIDEKIQILEDEYGFKLPSKGKNRSYKLRRYIEIIDIQYIAKIEHLIEIEDMSELEIDKQLEFRKKSIEGTHEEKKRRLQESNPEFAKMSMEEAKQICEKYQDYDLICVGLGNLYHETS